MKETSIVLTADVALMSDYNDSSVFGFMSALPYNYMPEWLAGRTFPTKSDDNGWIVCGTMITGFSEEKDDDVIKSIESVERSAKYDCFLFVLPFISIGNLRKICSIPVDNYLNDPLRMELIKKGLIKSTETASNFVKYRLSKSF